MNNAKLCISLSADVHAAIVEIANQDKIALSLVIDHLLRSKRIVGHLIQSGEFDCAIAAVAMATRSTIESVLVVAVHPCSDRGLGIAETQALLGNVSGCKWRQNKASWIEVESTSLAVLLIREQGQKRGHWVTVVDGFVHDPEAWNGCRVVDYPRATWSIVTMLQPR